MTTEGGARERQRFRDAVLLALGMEEGTMSQGVQADAESRNGVSPSTPRRSPALPTSSS